MGTDIVTLHLNVVVPISFNGSSATNKPTVMPHGTQKPPTLSPVY